MKEYFESYSNLAYNLVGLIGLHPYFIEAHGISFCMVMQALGVGSFTYHWYKSKPIFLFDWWAIMFVVTVTTGHIVNTPFIWLVVMLYQILYGYFIMGKINVYIETGFAIVPCLIAIGVERSLLDFSVVASGILIALWVRSKDEDPTQAKFHDSWAHSAWHVLTAPIFFIAWFGFEKILGG